MESVDAGGGLDIHSVRRRRIVGNHEDAATRLKPAAEPPENWLALRVGVVHVPEEAVRVDDMPLMVRGLPRPCVGDFSP